MKFFLTDYNNTYIDENAIFHVNLVDLKNSKDIKEIIKNNKLKEKNK